MTQYKKYSSLFLLMLLAVALGCASTKTREGTGEYIDDTAISVKVRTAILNAPSLESTEINVETFKGVVQLSGFVHSHSEIGTAGEVALRIDGVRAVRNDIRVKGQQ